MSLSERHQHDESIDQKYSGRRASRILGVRRPQECSQLAQVRNKGVALIGFRDTVEVDTVGGCKPAGQPREPRSPG